MISIEPLVTDRTLERIATEGLCSVAEKALIAKELLAYRKTRPLLEERTKSLIHWYDRAQAKDAPAEKELPPRPQAQGGDYRPHYRKDEADAFIGALEQKIADLESAAPKVVDSKTDNKITCDCIGDFCTDVLNRNPLCKLKPTKIEEQDCEPCRGSGRHIAGCDCPNCGGTGKAPKVEEQDGEQEPAIRTKTVAEYIGITEDQIRRFVGAMNMVASSGLIQTRCPTCHLLDDCEC